MALKMKLMAGASWMLERSKIELQLKVFSEQMDYQRKKDRRLYKSSSTT
jgi:hypothetical protein